MYSYTLTGHSNFVYSLKLLADNNLESGSRDNSIQIWDVDTGKCTKTLNGHSSFVYSLQLISY